MDEFAPYFQKTTTFVVRNIAPDKKVIRIFHYPILWNTTRDLMKIPGVSEASIRSSLLKGEIKHKILAKEIIVVECNTQLLSFDEPWKDFAENAGVPRRVMELEDSIVSVINDLGLDATKYLLRTNIPLIGARDSVNRTFYTPEKFINGLYYNNILNIKIQHNGKELYENIDFTVGESIIGQGYDMINIVSFTPNEHSLLYADYAIENI